MKSELHDLARAILEGSESDTMSFPQSVERLMAAGFDGYAVDFRRSARVYYMPEGDTIDLPTEPIPTPVAALFDAAAVRAAIREAQALVPGYTYRGFCTKVAAAGCAGYQVSLSGRRVVYYGRTGETHTELFPPAAP